MQHLSTWSLVARPSGGYFKKGARPLNTHEDGPNGTATPVSERNRMIECLPRQYRFSGTNGPGAQNISVNNGRVKISGIVD